MSIPGMTNTYIGARYVPILDGPWDETKNYEPIVMVTYQGATYLSKTYVPAGTPLTNTDFWILSANYNAQFAQLQSQVEQYQAQVTSLEEKVNSIPQISTNVFTQGVPIAISFSGTSHANVVENPSYGTAIFPINISAIENKSAFFGNARIYLSGYPSNYHAYSYALSVNLKGNTTNVVPHGATPAATTIVNNYNTGASGVYLTIGNGTESAIYLSQVAQIPTESNITCTLELYGLII